MDIWIDIKIDKMDIWIDIMIDRQMDRYKD